MSDQSYDDYRSSDSGGLPQDQQVHVEGLDTMRVKVTNIIDGIFRFARSASFSSRELSESGRSSLNSDRNNSQNNLLLTQSSSTTPTAATANSNPSSLRESVRGLNRAGGLHQRRSSMKKVKFKDHHDTSSSSAATTQLLGFSNKKDIDSNNTARTRNLLSDDSQRSSNDDMDLSWNVHLVNEDDIAGVSSTEIRIRESGGSFSLPRGSSKAAMKAVASLHKSDKNGKGQLKWFEKYMPDWVNLVRAFCGKVVLDDSFQLLMVLLILANAFFMGLATFDFIDEDPVMNHKFELVDYSFLVVFTIELALQFGYWGYQLFFDGWLLFDFVTVVSSWLLDGVQVFRSFRIFRAFRLVVRVPILKSLVYAVLHVLPRISSIMGLMILILYIFAVMVTVLFQDYYELGYTDVNYFGRLDYSLFTLFQFVTLEGWSDVVRQVAAVDYYANFIFGSFLTISAFILYSLVVAVVCDSFLTVETKIRAEMKAKAKLERLKRKKLKQSRKMKGGRNVMDEQLMVSDDDIDESDIDAVKPMMGNPFMHDPGDTEHASAYQMALRHNPAGKYSPSGPALAPPKKVSNPPPKKTNPPPRRISRGGGRPSSPPPPRSPSPSPRKKQALPPIPPPRYSSQPKKRESATKQKSRIKFDDESTEASGKDDAVKGGDVKKEVKSVQWKEDEAGESKANYNYSDDDDDDEDGPLDPLTFTETTSPTATTTTRTLAAGELERRRRSAKKKKKKQPAKQRIEQIQKRLDKLARAQAGILTKLEELCDSVEERNGKFTA